MPTLRRFFPSSWGCVALCALVVLVLSFRSVAASAPPARGAVRYSPCPSLPHARVQRAGVATTEAMREPEGPQVQCDVVLAHVRPGLSRGVVLYGLYRSGHPLAGAADTWPALGVVEPCADARGFLKALAGAKVAKVLAEPRLVTLSGNPASFLAGGEQAVPVPEGLGSVGVQFEEFGTRVNLLPTVLGNGKIRLEVEPEVSTLDPKSDTTVGGTPVPGRSTQRVRVCAELKSGQTLVIAGLKAGVGRDEVVLLITPALVTPERKP